jgi:uncharacterized FAD-dependent dehydrogenase
MLRIEVHTNLENPEDPVVKAIRQCGLKPQEVESARLWRRSLDARAGHVPCWVDLVDLETSQESRVLHAYKKARRVEPYHYALPAHGTLALRSRPVVVGFGPAGMAAALALAIAGYRPLVLERGGNIEERKKKVSAYWQGGALDPETNVQFGEGGAGAFSDGKLTTRVKDPRVEIILAQLIQAGADPSIAWSHHPHIGTDALCTIDENLRRRIEERGGEVLFHARMDDLVLDKKGVHALRLQNGQEIPAQAVLLALGHSARDTMRMLGSKKELQIEPKNFAVGVRVEHRQSFVDAWQYRHIPTAAVLPPAEYHLSHTSASGRGVYSFCMCPGGYVVDGASRPETVVTNGMSYAARDGRNANSAIIAQVDSRDFGSGLFDGLRFQESLEAQAYQLGQGRAPCQRIAHYLHETRDNLLQDLVPTFPRGTNLRDLHTLFSPGINEALEEFFRYMETIWPGFSLGDGMMTGVETRTSSPLRIVRNFETLESSVPSLWAAGEGAGFAGGIVSSAIDGLKCAEEIIRRYAPAP